MGDIVDKLNDLKTVLQEGRSLGVSTDALMEKVDSAIKGISDDNVRLVMMGSFSDGKTSAIAGLLAQVTDNMKIDPNESSDELTVYHFEGQDHLEIVDTPGLFGTKEKEIDGEVVKYSDITKKYISEANVLVYVCDAVNPVKQGHVNSLRTVLRDFGKLDSTIFVLNKMDESGIDTGDDDDYNYMSNKKKKSLITRLRETMDLTDLEAERVRAVCIAADPAERGLDYWLQNRESYLRQSRIGLLKSEIDKVCQVSDKDELKKKTGLAVLADVILQLKSQVVTLIRPLEDVIPELRSKNQDLEEDVANFRRELIDTMNRLQTSLKSYESLLYSGMDGCNMDTVGTFLENSIGLQGKEVSYHHVVRQINQYLSQCNEANRLTLNKAQKVFKQKCKESKSVIDKALEKGAKALGKLKVKNTDVLKTRDFLAKHFDWAAKIKFAPHGAKKLAGGITKGLSKASGVLSVFTEVIGTIGDAIREKKLQKLKIALKGDISQLLQQVYDQMNDEDSYFKNFAPSFLEMKAKLGESDRDLKELQAQLEKLQKYEGQLGQWVESIKMNNC